MNEALSDYVRKQFPALNKKVNGYPAAYLDGPGGYQVPESVIDAVKDYLIHMNANVGHQFETAERTYCMIQDTRSIFADFFNCDWDPWLQLQDRGILVDEAAIDTDTLTLDMADLREKLANRPKVVAVNYASNAVGTINDVRQIIRMSHEVGALTVVDAVHYAAHGPIDVKQIDVDFLLCSAYKFFGPHIGVLYAKKDVLSQLRPLNLRAQKQYPPFMLETGTLHHEGIAGSAAALEFIADIGRKFGNDLQGNTGELKRGRRSEIVAGLTVFEAYEQALTSHLIDAITREVPKAALYGPPPGHPRTSTVSFTLDGFSPEQVAGYLGSLGLFVWAGHFYAMRLVERLGLMDHGGLVRVGIAPYNTVTEVDRLVAALKDEDALKRYVESLS
jgi:selenocysteine lyase/cysteine desulfurase